MKYTCLFSFLLLFFANDFLQAQIPAPPIYLVTVDPETGYDSIVWIDPHSPLIDYFAVAYRIPPSPGKPETYITVASGITDDYYVYRNSDSGLNPVGYTVWGVKLNPPNNDLGDFNPPDSTMFLQAKFDHCTSKIDLKWNDYNNWRGSTTGFTIYRRIGPHIYQPLATVGPGTLTYTLNNVTPNDVYELFIQAANTDGVRKSNSNRVDVTTGMAVLTGTINADYGTIGPGNTIDLSFTVYNSSGENKYNLYRSMDTINEVLVTSVLTTDTILRFNDNIDFTSGIYYYRLELMNDCDIAVSKSNFANNIILNGGITGLNVSLGWNPYSDWNGGLDHYSVIRTAGENRIDTFNTGTAKYFTDNVENLIDYANPASSKICYQAQATERVNSFGTSGTSQSNQVCFTITPDVRVPNAFIPNDGDPVNRVFEPVFSFIPEHYEFTIYNRLGNRIWEGSGPWDGTQAGKLVPEGVYVYQLRIYNYSSDIRKIEGKVVVVYR
jgi:hypothetical protein